MALAYTLSLDQVAHLEAPISPVLDNTPMGVAIAIRDEDAPITRYGHLCRFAEGAFITARCEALPQLHKLGTLGVELDGLMQPDICHQHDSKGQVRSGQARSGLWW